MRQDQHRRAERPLISVAQAAELAGVSEATGYRWLAQGDLPGAVWVGRRWYVRRHVLEAWLEEVSARSSAAWATCTSCTRRPPY